MKYPGTLEQSPKTLPGLRLIDSGYAFVFARNSVILNLLGGISIGCAGSQKRQRRVMQKPGPTAQERQHTAIELRRSEIERANGRLSYQGNADLFRAFSATSFFLPLSWGVAPGFCIARLWRFESTSPET